MEKESQHIINELISNYNLQLIILFVVLFFNRFINNFISGIFFTISKDFKVDDIVIINEKKYRLVRQTPFKTVFYSMENKRKLIISNRKLHYLLIEKEIDIDNVNEKE